MTVAKPVAIELTTVPNPVNTELIICAPFDTLDAEPVIPSDAFFLKKLNGLKLLSLSNILNAPIIPTAPTPTATNALVHSWLNPPTKSAIAPMAFAINSTMFPIVEPMPSPVIPNFSPTVTTASPTFWNAVATAWIAPLLAKPEMMSVMKLITLPIAVPTFLKLKLIPSKASPIALPTSLNAVPIFSNAPV